MLISNRRGRWAAQDAYLSFVISVSRCAWPLAVETATMSPGTFSGLRGGSVRIHEKQGAYTSQRGLLDDVRSRPRAILLNTELSRRVINVLRILGGDRRPRSASRERPLSSVSIGDGDIATLEIGAACLNTGGRSENDNKGADEEV